MKRFICSIVFTVSLGLIFASSMSAQSSTFSDKLAEYTFDLPEPTWKMNVKPTEKDPNPQFIYGYRINGHLQIDKTSIKHEATLSDLVRETNLKLQFKPSYIAGKEETFAGALRGKIFNYEYVQSGKNMSGRVYLLKADDSTVYTLHFTGLREQLRAIRNQIDSIARTFKISKTAE